MLLPYSFHDFAEVQESGPLLPPVSLKPSAIESYAQSIPQDIGDSVFLTYAKWDKNTQYITCDNNAFTRLVPNCRMLDVAYDQLNRLNVAYINVDQLYLYWFDSTIASFTTSYFGVVIQAFFFMDDVRRLQQGNSTLMLVYTRGTNIYYRTQYDRFTIEHVAGTIAEDTFIKHVGMNDHNRVQITIGPVDAEEMFQELVVVDDSYISAGQYWVGDTL